MTSHLMPGNASESDLPRMAQRYLQVRAQTLALAAPLSDADCQVQSMPDASPTKWHLAHVTWFFETFVLERFEPGFAPFHPAFRVLFNSYYQTVGAQHPRPQRGLITRPDMADIRAYRAQVDERVARLLHHLSPSNPHTAEVLSVMELGLQHEQQHQELLLTDIKHLLSCNPIWPTYLPACSPIDLPAESPVYPPVHSPARHPTPHASVADATPLAWVNFEAALANVGHAGTGFAFDNECPRHPAWVQPFTLANRLITHGEWLAFVADGGYTHPQWWMSAGWEWVCANRVTAPQYWLPTGNGGWTTFTLHGRVPIDPHTPMVHVNWFEADACARWLGHQQGLPLRLPTEAEWEHAANCQATHWAEHGNFLESGALHPVPLASRAQGLAQMGGDAWEWTGSSYLPHPGYQPWAGAVGEYNGKFMVNQMVLKGGSCATPRAHIRASYRNFFPTDARWQFTGVRLARSL